MEPIGCPEPSVRDDQDSVRGNIEERNSLPKKNALTKEVQYVYMLQ
jgi:hypothetical protein